LIERGGEGDADLLTFLVKGRLGPCPDDIVNGQVITEDTLGALICVDNSGKAGAIEPEEIEKGTVLPERILIVRVIHRALLVA